ncbi:hypothetical protein [Candidatus Parabeggiatoa sp. HSG14]|uniref:hypothetical protein n=1 Tax=Candidatus Parabeggiatoa sp. HSG14 TaxID=3055593 RepID=UPI0032E37ABC
MNCYKKVLILDSKNTIALENLSTINELFPKINVESSDQIITENSQNVESSDQIITENSQIEKNKKIKNIEKEIENIELTSKSLDISHTPIALPSNDKTETLFYDNLLENAPLISPEQKTYSGIPYVIINQTDEKTNSEHSSDNSQLLAIIPHNKNEIVRDDKVYLSNIEPRSSTSTHPKEETEQTEKIVKQSSKDALKKQQKRVLIKNKNSVVTLQQCEIHFKANRLTTGKKGTAFDCYNKVLVSDPNNVQAKTGLRKIEKRYQQWTELALKKERVQSAHNYIKRLRHINPNSPTLLQLQKRLMTLKRQQSKQRRVTSQPPRKNTTVRQDTVTSQQKKVPPKKNQPSQCSDILLQQSLGIRPLTLEQKIFRQQFCN